MRIIEVCDSAIRSVAVSPDGRYVAAFAEDRTFGVYQWATGDPVIRANDFSPCDQIVFGPNGDWVARAGQLLRLNRLTPTVSLPSDLSGGVTGGVAVSPDGKLLVAVLRAGWESGLAQWSLPALRQQTGFTGWPPFRRLAFSPNGDYLAGIWPGTARETTWSSSPAEFEIRFARSGGLDYHYPPMKGGAFTAPGFVSFTRNSGTCAFGWEGEFHVLDTSTGTSRYVCRIEAQFRDAGFTGSGHLFATVEDAGLLKLWDVKTWQVEREYDWGCGPLRCLAFTADGSAGVCGTTDGRLVQFDVDE
jgi:WD40 repeat protein